MATVKRNSKTDFICKRCRDANRTGDTHPGMMHPPGICDCSCRD
jgi:hypothetical protein